MAGKSYKSEQRKTTVADTISNFYSDIAELAEECRELVDNASGTPAETTQRIQTFSDTADTLENVQEVDADALTDALSAAEVTLYISVPRSRRMNTSRAVRCENACSYGRAGIEYLREWCDCEEESLAEAKEGDDSEESQNVSAGAVALVSQMRKEREQLIQEVRDYCDEVEHHIDECESAEFPGMYG